MNRLLLFLLASVILGSCSPTKVYKVKGDYPETPIKIHSSKSFDEVWENLVDLFAQKGLAIRTIDKNSGLIVSEKSRLPVTVEDDKGKLKDSTAFIVVPKYRDAYTHKLVPVSGQWYNRSIDKMINYDAEGDWNVILKKTDTGCLINVNITNLSYTNRVSANSRKPDQVVALSSGRTTGVFENLIADSIK